MFANDLPRTEFFNQSSVQKIYKEKYKEINITNEFLEKLDQEHKLLKRMSMEYKNIPNPNKENDSHLIRINNKIIEIYLSK